MRYFRYNTQTGDKTVSEEYIRREYYWAWRRKICEEYGTCAYAFEECLKDWITEHSAWEVKE